MFCTLDRHALGFHPRANALFIKHSVETGSHIVKQHAVLRAFGPGERGAHITQVKRQGGCENRIQRPLRAVHALGFGVLFHEIGTCFAATGGFQIANRVLVDREEPACCAIFGCHICNCRLVFQRQIIEARPVKLDKFADHAFFAQHFNNGQNEIRRGRAFRKPPGQAEADDFGQQHGDGLAEHCGFGFNAANAPAQHGKAVHHGCVAVGAHQRVGIGNLNHFAILAFFAGPDCFCQMLQIDLMANARAGGHNAEIFKGLRAPAQKLIALAVALIFQRHIIFQRPGRAEMVNHDGVVNDQIDRGQRIDLVCVTAYFGHGIAHGCKVNYGRHAGEILHQHARRTIGNFAG